jgi:hypothetical protein
MTKQVSLRVVALGSISNIETTIEPIAVAADVDDVAVMDQAIDQRGGHHLVAKDLALLGKALVRREHGAGVFVAARHELEEEHRARARDGQIADLVDDQERRKAQRLHAVLQMARLLRVLERRDEIGERAVVDPSSALCRRDGETDREMRFPDARRPEGELHSRGAR